VLIRRDKIAAVGRVDAPEGVWTVDARGLTVTPGLIDAHTHADLALMQNRQQPNALYQGISTMIVGQCGLGFAPMAPEALDEAIRMNSGIFGGLPAACSRWSSFSEFLTRLDGCAVNVGAMVSHNAVRQAACGYANIPLTGDRLERALSALDGALREGALGLSVGLSYYPGGYSDAQELVNLCRGVKARDGLFCVHMRLDVNNPDFRPMEEIAHVAEETLVRTNMLHHRTGGFEPYTDVTAPFERAIRAGAQVSFEFYPYLVGSGLVMAVLPIGRRKADRTRSSPGFRTRRCGPG
jgi:N-acyl-D-amino-acid deacylase